VQFLANAGAPAATPTSARCCAGFLYAIIAARCAVGCAPHADEAPRSPALRTTKEGNPDMKTTAGVWARAFRWLTVCAGFGALGVLAGCSSTGNFPPAPVSASTQDYTYIVGPGDNINIIVWRNPEISMSVPVRPDGKFSTPLIDELVAQGKTSVQISREIEQQLSKYVRDPVVTGIVTGFVGPYDQQIRVVGEAARPQGIPFKQYMTLLDVMIAVGGLTDFADGNGASILRTSDGGNEGAGGKQFSVRLRDLIRRGDISANVEMKPGDILIIPQGFF